MTVSLTNVAELTVMPFRMGSRSPHMKGQF